MAFEDWCLWLPCNPCWQLDELRVENIFVPLEVIDASKIKIFQFSIRLLNKIFLNSVLIFLVIVVNFFGSDKGKERSTMYKRVWKGLTMYSRA